MMEFRPFNSTISQVSNHNQGNQCLVNHILVDNFIKACLLDFLLSPYRRSFSIQPLEALRYILTLSERSAFTLKFVLLSEVTSKVGCHWSRVTTVCAVHDLVLAALNLFSLIWLTCVSP